MTFLHPVFALALANSGLASLEAFAEKGYVEGHGVSAGDLGRQYADLVLRMVRPWSATPASA